MAGGQCWAVQEFASTAQAVQLQVDGVIGVLIHASTSASKWACKCVTVQLPAVADKSLQLLSVQHQHVSCQAGLITRRHGKSAAERLLRRAVARAA